eukprot:m.18071 g.18071  ORF g.18071 m.18071 type:complete len:448 (+) comp10746_c0_seq1:64-1407(+)
MSFPSLGVPLNADESDNDDLGALMDALDDDNDDELLSAPPTKPDTTATPSSKSFTIPSVSNTPLRTQNQSSAEAFKTPSFVTPRAMTQSRSQPSQRQDQDDHQGSQARSTSQPLSQANAASSISTAKPKLPGTFGLLPPLSADTPMNIKFRQLMQLKGLQSAFQGDEPSMSPAQSFADRSQDFVEIPWTTMLKDADKQAWGAGKSVNLAVVKEDHTPGKLPFMLVRVCQYTYRNRMPSLVVHDPSGQINASLHPKILERPESSFLQTGAVLVLYDVSTFEPMARSPCLNITLRNLLRIYPTVSAVGDGPYQPITVSQIPTKQFQSKRRPKDQSGTTPSRLCTSTPSSTPRARRQEPPRLAASSHAPTPHEGRSSPAHAKRGNTATPLPNPYTKHAKRTTVPSQVEKARVAQPSSQPDNDRLLLSQSLELDDDELDGLLNALDDDDDE